MKDWNPMNWIGYGFFGVMALLNALGAGAKEKPLSDWFSPFIKIYILGYGPALFFMMATIFFIKGWRRSRKSIGADNAKVNPPVSTTLLPPIPALAKPKKFYSDRNKSDLANALTDLSEILNKNGPNIKQKADQIVTIWNDETRKGNIPNFANIIVKLNEVGNLANNLYNDLYTDNGFLKKHIGYDDELFPILQAHKIPLNTPNIPNDSIPTFQGNINGFRNVLMTIQRAEKHNDRDLIILMMADSRLSFENYMKGIREFKEWLDDTHKRIGGFRNSQL